MPGPWEKYGTSAPKGPWERYAQPEQAQPAPKGGDRQPAILEDIRAIGEGRMPENMGARTVAALGKAASGAGEAVGFGLKAMGSPLQTAAETIIGEVDRSNERLDWMAHDINAGEYGRAALNVAKAFPMAGLALEGILDRPLETMGQIAVGKLATKAPAAGVEVADRMVNLANTPGAKRAALAALKTAAAASASAVPVVGGYAAGRLMESAAKDVAMAVKQRRGASAPAPAPAPTAPAMSPLERFDALVAQMNAAHEAAAADMLAKIQPAKAPSSGGKAPSILPKAPSTTQKPRIELASEPAIAPATPEPYVVTPDPVKVRLIEKAQRAADEAAKKKIRPRTPRKPARMEEVSTALDDDLTAGVEDVGTAESFKGIHQSTKVKRYSQALRDGGKTAEEVQKLQPVIDELGKKGYETVAQAEHWLGRDHPDLPALKTLVEGVSASVGEPVRIPSPEAFRMILDNLAVPSAKAAHEAASVPLKRKRK